MPDKRDTETAPPVVLDSRKLDYADLPAAVRRFAEEVTMREDEMLEVLRKSHRKRPKPSMTIAVHVLSDGKCTVQVGSRVVLEGVSRAVAMQSAEERKARLEFSDISALIKVFEDK